MAKKNKGATPNRVEVMNASLQEEAKCRVRAFHVRVIVWEEKATPLEDAHALATKMGHVDMHVMHAWRVGMQSKELIPKFHDMRWKKAFLSKWSALKGLRIYLDEDLAPAQFCNWKCEFD